MAGHAVFILREVGDFFAHREVGLKVGVLEFNGIGRGLKEAPEDVAAEIDTAMDGGGLFVVGKGGENSSPFLYELLIFYISFLGPVNIKTSQIVVGT